MAICPSSQTPYRPNNDQTIVGITSSSLFRIDPRQPRMNKLCESEYKKYSSRPEFSTVSSSRSKHVAVGSKKGVIRIFDELNTVASITLPPIGEPILGLDIMPNGHYVLATCSNFLMLVHTISHDQAMTLRIRPEHVTLMNENVSFKRAYFDTLNENNIICVSFSFFFFFLYIFCVYSSPYLSRFSYRQRGLLLFFGTLKVFVKATLIAIRCKDSKHLLLQVPTLQRKDL